MLESKEELNSLLIKMKDENEKAGLKLNIEKSKIMVSSPITSWQIGKNGNSDRLVFLRSKIAVEGDCSHEIKRHLLLGRKAMINLDNRLKKQAHYFADKDPSSQNYGFSSNHVWMWELDYREGWVMKNWCFWTVVLKKTLESPLDSKEIKQVNPKENQPWIFIGKTDAKAEAPTLWPPDAKN